eukprot:1157345-Pelagomonas_calceolata.AAC.7
MMKKRRPIALGYNTCSSIGLTCAVQRTRLMQWVCLTFGRVQPNGNSVQGGCRVLCEAGKYFF